MFSSLNYYEILGVNRDSEHEVIVAAYRAMMLKYHPDTNIGNNDAHAKATLLNEAFETLKNKRTRSEYDKFIDQSKSDNQSKSEMNTHEHYNSEQPINYNESIYKSNQSWKSILIILFILFILFAIGWGSVSTPDKTPDISSDYSASPIKSSIPQNKSPSFPDEEPVIFTNIERAAKDFAAIFDKKGILGARTKSEECLRNLQSNPSWKQADYCVAFAYAAQHIDSKITNSLGFPENSYFKFQVSNTDEIYKNVNPNTVFILSRTDKISDIAKSVAEENTKSLYADFNEEDFDENLHEKIDIEKLNKSLSSKNEINTKIDDSSFFNEPSTDPKVIMDSKNISNENFKNTEDQSSKISK
ncbi:hypothetical protein DMP17_12080 [Pseudonocardia sp. TMWB2A]|uniref:J domain-containing protein n=1 Tax=Pseudonocardia sp. TMWB2A TaxID=687430 RepID=UPI00307CD4E0